MLLTQNGEQILQDQLFNNASCSDTDCPLFQLTTTEISTVPDTMSTSLTQMEKSISAIS